MENVKKYKRLIKFAIRSPVKKRLDLLKKFNSEIIKTVCEIFLNTISGTIPVPPKVLRGLNKYKQLVYKLVDPKVSIEVKKEELIRNKGAVLLPIVNIIP
jgi:hypothetical protein